MDFYVSANDQQFHDLPHEGKINYMIDTNRYNFFVCLMKTVNFFYTFKKHKVVDLFETDF